MSVASRRRASAHIHAPRPCAGCGEPMTPKRGDHRFHNAECRADHTRVLNRERNRRYQDRNRERVRASWRAYNQRNKDRIRAYNRLPKSKARLKRYRFEARGRVCVSCGEPDSRKNWSPRVAYCRGCYERGRENGFCRKCGEARWKTEGQGVAPGRERCSCATALPPVDDLTLSLHDALRFRDETAWTYTMLADAMRHSARHVERRIDDLLELIRRFDPGARLERDRTAPGSPMTLVLDTPRVRRGLERLVNGEEAA